MEFAGPEASALFVMTVLPRRAVIRCRTTEIQDTALVKAVKVFIHSVDGDCYSHDVRFCNK